MLSSSTPKGFLRHEVAIVLFILAAFVAISMLVAVRTPTVFCDEPGYCDPAINLYLGKGFTSTLWGQVHTVLWTGNVPLYQGTLFCFFKVFGLGFFQARVANTILTAAGGLLIWLSLRRTNLVQNPGSRILSLALVLSGSVSTLTFRTNRYDVMMFFVCALVFFACSLQLRAGLRYAAIIACSALLPAAGVPMLPYVCLLIAIHAAVYRFVRWDRLLCVAMGLFVGVICLFLFYSYFSSWKQFLGGVLPFTAAAAGEHGGSHILRKIMGIEGESLFTSFFGNPTEFVNQKILFDYSAALLFIIVIVISLKVWRLGSEADRKFIRFIVAVTLVVPPMMFMAGHYRSFYRWMTYIPLAIAAPRLLEIYIGNIRAALIPRLALATMGFSILLGVPLRTLAVVPSWTARSPGPLERVTKQVVQPSDIVLCNFKAYFAIRPRAAEVWAMGLPAFGDLRYVKDMPTNNISLLCVSPENFDEAAKTVGGKWKKLTLTGADAEALGKSRYALDFYRRSE
jgi:hypothetical protein